MHSSTPTFWPENGRSPSLRRWIHFKCGLHYPNLYASCPFTSAGAQRLDCNQPVSRKPVQTLLLFFFFFYGGSRGATCARIYGSAGRHLIRPWHRWMVKLHSRVEVKSGSREWFPRSVPGRSEKNRWDGGQKSFVIKKHGLDFLMDNVGWIKLGYKVHLQKKTGCCRNFKVFIHTNNPDSIWKQFKNSPSVFMMKVNMFPKHFNFNLAL